MQSDTAPQQLLQWFLSPPSPGRLNGVGYSTTDNTAEDTSFIFGAPFSGIATKGVISFKDLACPQEFEDDDQIQTAYTDENGITRLYGYVYFGEWYNEDMDPVADEDGIPLGSSAWFISSSAKTITTSGEVSNDNVIHTFTETSALVSSAFPTPFCPNSENVSWGVSDDAQIQTAYTDENGITRLYGYVYFGEWYNEDMDPLAETDSIAAPGTGFWLILNDASETFSEVSPLAKN